MSSRHARHAVKLAPSCSEAGSVMASVSESGLFQYVACPAVVGVCRWTPGLWWLVEDSDSIDEGCTPGRGGRVPFFPSV